MDNNSSNTQNSLVIGCVTEPVAKYLQQAARLLLSLRWFGGKIADAPFILCTTGKLSAETESFFKKYDAQIVLIERFSTKHNTEEHGPSNKIRFLELDILDQWGQILLLDCDTVIVQDPSEFLHTSGISVKVADLPTVTTEQFQDLFQQFDLTIPKEEFVHDISGEPCISYFNSGVILLNASWRKEFVNTWIHYNKAIIDKWDTLTINSFYTDQASLTLVINAISIPLTLLPNSMNLAGHLSAQSYPDYFFNIDPIIIHYHGLFDENGYLNRIPLNQANRRINSFNARLRAEKLSKKNQKAIDNKEDSSTNPPKVVVGSGWWCNNTESEWDIGCKATRSIPFFSLWLTQVTKYLSPHKIVITDSHSPLKPDHDAYDLVQWIELDKNYGHANDIRTNKIDTKHSGFTRSVLQGCMYALNCDADYYVYVEQDCLITGENFLNQAIGENTEDILIGQPTEGGVGLNGETALPMKQQSLIIVKKSGMERFISGLLSADWSDGEVSPEITMERQYDPLGTVSIPYGRSRPVNFNQPCFYVQHLTSDELERFIKIEKLEDTWQKLTKQHYFEFL